MLVNVNWRKLTQLESTLDDDYGGILLRNTLAHQHVLTGGRKKINPLGGRAWQFCASPLLPEMHSLLWDPAKARACLPIGAHIPAPHEVHFVQQMPLDRPHYRQLIFRRTRRNLDVWMRDVRVQVDLRPRRVFGHLGQMRGARGGARGGGGFMTRPGNSSSQE